jgi:hypothetical protein
VQTEKLSAEKLNTVIINDLIELLFQKKAFQWSSPNLFSATIISVYLHDTTIPTEREDPATPHRAGGKLIGIK